MKKSALTTSLIIIILLLVAATVTSNYIEQAKIDNTKLPEKVELSEGFQRWIINLKKRMDIEAENFRLKDENEIYSGDFLKITKLDGADEIQNHIQYVATFLNENNYAFSPDNRQFIDYRHEVRRSISGDEYEPYEAHYYGLRDETLIDARILSCLPQANCYFDRAYFLDNHTFVISEISLQGIERRQAEAGDYEACAIDEVCTYTFKLHFFDLINNSRTVYESSPKELNLAETIQFF